MSKYFNYHNEFLRILRCCCWVELSMSCLRIMKGYSYLFLRIYNSLISSIINLSLLASLVLAFQSLYDKLIILAIISISKKLLWKFVIVKNCNSHFFACMKYDVLIILSSNNLAHYYHKVIEFIGEELYS